ncbi:MAG: radical SAM protein [Prevotellaceae bacterium]|jgi:MoaA/NifB/PqqE/SkfB family radical SAM enzyme|nr:radical SAM protein [Prevotellaceae bacterium]
MVNLKDILDTDTILKEKYRIENLDNSIITLELVISQKCNLQCKHCYFGDKLPSKSPLSRDEWINIIENAIQNGIKHFHFSGKEPLLNNDLFSVLSYIAKQKNKYSLFYGIVSNGISVEKHIYEKLLSTNLDYIEFSVEGTKDINDFIRGNNHFEKLVTKLDSLLPNDKISTSTTLSEINKDYFLDLLDILIEKKMTKIFAAPLHFVGSAIQNSLNIISPIDLLNIIENSIKKITQLKSTNQEIDLKFCISDFYTEYLINNEHFMSEKLKLYLEYGKPIYWNINGHIVEIALQFVDIPFLRQLIITDDGYILSDADDINKRNYYELSLDNVKKCNFCEIMKLRKKYISNYFTNFLF